MITRLERTQRGAFLTVVVIICAVLVLSFIA
jgi:hypothetical protein